MTENFEQYITSKEVTDFISVAGEYCTYVENVSDLGREEFFRFAQEILSALYYHAVKLPVLENIFEEGNERFVTEEDWQFVHDSVLKKAGSFDTYPEVFDGNINETDNFVTSSIAENLADIYQDIKDFTLLYNVGTNEIMNDAIWECRLNFKEYWGQKLCNVLRAVHNVVSKDNDLSESEEEEKKEEIRDYEKELENRDTKSWLISKRFDDLKDDGDEE